MPATEPGKIRNIAVVGHRGVGKTSLVEAHAVPGGEDEPARRDRAGHDGRRLGRRRAPAPDVALRVARAPRLAGPQDQPRRLPRATPASRPTRYAALRVVEGALVVLSGVMGVEVNTARVWARAEEYELSRVVFVNMLDRERADFFRVLDAVRAQLSDRCVAIQLPIGAEHELTGRRRPAAHVRVHRSGRRQGGRAAADPGRDGRRRCRSTARSSSTRSSRRTRT